MLETFPVARPDAVHSPGDVALELGAGSARLLLPRWLERGQGHLICTVSAAGLLTMLGAAPYSATKHAALAFEIEVAIVVEGGRRDREYAGAGGSGCGHRLVPPIAV